MSHKLGRIKQDSSESKILGFQEASRKIQEIKNLGLRVILAQGVFDIVHIGHVEYFRAAKQAGDILFVGIENDETVHLNKGPNRPFFTFKDRLEFLTEFCSVDFIFGFENIPDYGKSVDMYVHRYKKLKPTAVAVSSWDPNLKLKKRQAKEAGIELAIITHNKRESSTRLLQMIGYE